MNGIKIAFGFFGKQVELLSGVPIIFLDGSLIGGLLLGYFPHVLLASATTFKARCIAKEQEDYLCLPSTQKTSYLDIFVAR